MVDLVQPLSILGDLLFGGAVPSLLQELQGLGRYRANDLRAGAAEGETPGSGRRAVTRPRRQALGKSRWAPPLSLGGRAERSTSPPGPASPRTRPAVCACGSSEEETYILVSDQHLPFVTHFILLPSCLGSLFICRLSLKGNRATQ